MYKSLTAPILAALIPCLLILISFWVQLQFPAWTSWGLIPRNLKGLVGILTTPFLHESTEHLFANLVPLASFLFLLWVQYRPLAAKVLTLIYLVTGWCVWLGARENLHIGASGIVYGLAFFLFVLGIIKFKKNRAALQISLFVALFYGSMWIGIFPIQEHVSWESHLFGAITGTALAIFYHKDTPNPDIYIETHPESEDGAWNFHKHFPPPDGFDSPN